MRGGQGWARKQQWLRFEGRRQFFRLPHLAIFRVCPAVPVETIVKPVENYIDKADVLSYLNKTAASEQLGHRPRPKSRGLRENRCNSTYQQRGEPRQKPVGVCGH